MAIIGEIIQAENSELFYGTIEKTFYGITDELL